MKNLAFKSILTILLMSSVASANYYDHYSNGRSSSTYSIDQQVVMKGGSHTIGLNGPFYVGYQGLRDISENMREKLGISNFHASASSSASNENAAQASTSSAGSFHQEPTAAPQFTPGSAKESGPSSTGVTFAQVASQLSETTSPRTELGFAQASF